MNSMKKFYADMELLHKKVTPQMRMEYKWRKFSSLVERLSGILYTLLGK